MDDTSYVPPHADRFDTGSICHRRRGLPRRVPVMPAAARLRRERRGAVGRGAACLAGLLLLCPGPAGAADDRGAARGLVISEVLGSTVGFPDSEYIEISGPPAASLAGLSVVVVEGEDRGQIGDISYRVDFGRKDRLGRNGYFLVANEQAARTYALIPDLPLEGMIENGSYTVALVETATLADGAVSGGEEVLDAIGLRNPRGRRADRFFFDAPVPDVGGSGFLPAGMARLAGPGTPRFRALDFDNRRPPNTPTAGSGPADGGGAPALDGEPTLVSAIQGNAERSGLVGRIVVAEGVVVGDFQDGDGDAFRDLGGFFLMEERADFDGDDATSEGVFVADAGLATPVDVVPGDLVRVSGRVAEWYGKTTLEAEQIRVETRRAVPDVLSVAVETGLPPAGEREAVESMLLSFREPLTWIGDYGYETRGEALMAAGGPVDQYTQLHAPDVTGNRAARAEVADRTILLDDGSDRQRTDGDPIHAPDGELLRPETGLRLGLGYDLTAIMDEAFSEFRLRLPAGAAFQPAAPARPRGPPRPDVDGAYRVGSLNVLNYFTTISGGTAVGLAPRGADSAEELRRQTEKLVTVIGAMDVDLLALNEIENEFGGGATAIAELVRALNAELGARDWAYVDPGRRFVGTDAIAVGFLYDRRTTRIAAGTEVAVLTDSGLGALGLDPGHPVFDGPGTSRPPLAATFEEIATGGRFTAVAAHLKSKGSLSPFGDNSDRGDGQGNNAEVRTQAAVAIAAWIETDPTGWADGDRLILGDLNSYAMEDPVRALARRGYVNLVERSEGLVSASYRFAGRVGTLDYAMASGALAEQAAGAAIWDVNAEAPGLFDYRMRGGRARIERPREQGLFDGSSPVRASDHDPLMVGLDLRGEALLLAQREIQGRFGEAASGGDRAADTPLLVRTGPGADRADPILDARRIIEALRSGRASTLLPFGTGRAPTY